MVRSSLADQPGTPLGADGWMPIALWRLGQDPLSDKIPPAKRLSLLHAARTAGHAMAGRMRRQEWTSAEAALRELGVRLVEEEHGAERGSLVYHALYTAPPPTVTLYCRPLAALERLIEGEGFRPTLGDVNVRELVLTHELFHHLVARDGAPPAVRPRIEVLCVGGWRRMAVVTSAEEIAAAGFTARWHNLSWPPELLDCLTLIAYRRPAGLALLRLSVDAACHRAHSGDRA